MIFLLEQILLKKLDGIKYIFFVACKTSAWKGSGRTILSYHDFRVWRDVVSMETVEDGREPSQLVVDVVSAQDVTDERRISAPGS